MQRRTLRITLEIAAGIIAGLAILIGIGFWRLSAGPVSLSFLTPAVQNALNQVDSRFDIEIEDTVLSWGGWDRAIDILVKNVTLRQNGRQPLAVLPELSVGLSIEALGRGVIAPTSLEILAPEIRIRRYADGRFSFGIQGAGADSAMEDAPVSPALIDALMRPPDPESRLAYLTRVSVIGASTILSDRLGGVTWRMPDTNVVLVRDGNELRGNASATLQVGDAETSVSAVLLRSLDTQDMSLTVGFNQFGPDLIARAVPEAAFLKDIKTSLSGSLGVRLFLDGTPHQASLDLRSDFGRAVIDLGVADDGSLLDATLQLIEIDTLRLAEVSPELADLRRVATRLNGKARIAATPDGEVLDVDFSLHGDAGTVDLSELGLPAAGFRAISLIGRADAAFESLILEEARIDFLTDSAFSARGAAVRDGDGYAIDLAAELERVPFNRVREFWPEDIAGGAREWIIPNIPAAYVPQAAVEVRGRLPADDPSAVEIDRLSGTMDIENATVHYFRPLPPVIGVSGKANFGLNFFKIVTEGGQVGDRIKVRQGIVDLTELDSVENASITVALETPLTDALELLDHEPLGLIRKLDIAPTDIAGHGVAEASFKFRLLNSLKADDILYAARATLAEVSMQNAPLGSTVTRGALELKLDTSGMSITGDAAMNGEPILIDWRENFQDTEALRSRYDVVGQIDDAFLRDIGIDFAPYWKGEAAVDLTYQSFRDAPARLDVSADIGQSELAFDFLEWKKTVDEEGAVSFTMVLPEGQRPIIRDIAVAAGTLQGRGSVELSTDFSEILLVGLQSVRYDGNDFSGTVRRRSDGGLSIQVAGDRFDIEPFLGQDEGIRHPEHPENSDGLPFDLSAAFNTLDAGSDRRVQNARVTVLDNGQHILRLALDSEVSSGVPFQVRLEPSGQGQTLSISSNNAGVALGALGLTSRISGGGLNIAAARSTLESAFEGTVRISDFVLVDAPGLAKLLEFMSLTGVLSALSDSGLQFSELSSDFTFEDGFLTLDNLRAYGTSIGVTANGTIDTVSEFIELEGTVVPAYTVNRVLGAIPILGPLVVGGEGQGLFAANYRVDGPIEDPAVAVNPLSALAPSFLRRLFKADTDPSEPIPSERSEDGNAENR